ncbi:CAP domain-containing protein [Borrelia venezuelensis]|uniref:CAP domain-containing protein n=1 Tax=Borrelia venezuelensis TaxID=1653839 RepID=UPI001FF1BCFF|nr:CAP domain-containing protein [Borrelia venezuelensis]UPA12334.1 CAP domain-containing protein [Borrelia venezuelensis]
MQKKFISIILIFTSQFILLGINEDLEFLYSSIHQLRNDLHLEKLEIDKTLEIVAKEYAINLNENKVLTHTLFGTTPMQRVKKYDKYFCRIREILAAGMDVQDVTGAWLKSKKHKEALLNKDTSKMGGYVLQTKDKKNIFVVLLGEKF